MPTVNPRDYADLGWQVANRLHAQGVVTDPGDPQPGEVGVAVNGWSDQPDTCVNINGPWEAQPDSETVPSLRFMVAIRASSQREVWELRAEVLAALRTGTRRYQLTADVDMLDCRRVVSDPLVPDVNDRWVTVDTYECRPYRNFNL